jgi:hypothetical protein
VKSGEALGFVKVCFYFGGKFSVLSGWWLLVWNGDISALVLLSVTSHIDCGLFEKCIGKFDMCLSAFLTNDVHFFDF